MMRILLFALFICLNCDSCYGQFIIPKIKLEAFTGKGFRASIVHIPGIKLFAFHGRLNAPISNVDPGDFFKDVLVQTNGFWVYDDKDLQIHVGDKLYYWVHVQHERSGYRRNGEVWNVEELIDESPLQCEASSTVINRGQTVCKSITVFEDNFNNFDEGLWTIENYMPLTGPNFEFNSYEKNSDTINTTSSKLLIEPSVARGLRGFLDLRTGCTSRIPEECFHQHIAASFVPPIRSAKITSKFSFKYGRIDVKAILPAGDWIFPEIALIPIDGDREFKICIAYSRGNQILLASDGTDLGSKLLFAGPMPSSKEPKRSSILRSRLNRVPYYENEHVYSIEWRPGTMRFLLDGMQFGDITNTAQIAKELDREFSISLGVGVGGINDFPDGFRSGLNVKPWRNRDRRQMLNFFDAKNVWMNSWLPGKNALQVDYVRVTSI